MSTYHNQATADCIGEVILSTPYLAEQSTLTEGSLRSCGNCAMQLQLAPELRRLQKLTVCARLSNVICDRLTSD